MKTYQLMFGTMTWNTQRDHIQSMFLVIAVRVMVDVCLLATMTTNKFARFGQKTLFGRHDNVISNTLYGFTSIFFDHASTLRTYRTAPFAICSTGPYFKFRSTLRADKFAAVDFATIVTALDGAVTLFSTWCLRWFVFDRFVAMSACRFDPTFGDQWNTLTRRSFTLQGAESAYKALAVIEAKHLAAAFTVHGIHTWLVGHFSTPVQSNSSIPQEMQYA